MHVWARRLAILTIVAITPLAYLAFGAEGFARGKSAAATQYECGQRYTIIGSRGSGEQLGDHVAFTKYGQRVAGMSAPGAKFAVEFANRLPAGAVTFVANPYPARGGFVDMLGALLRIGPLGAYHGSVNDGKNLLWQIVSTQAQICPNVRLVLIGLSQGAQVTGDVYQSLLSPSLRSRVKGVVLWGDPYFNGGDSATAIPTSSRNGILGTRAPYPSGSAGKVFSYCHAKDPVCQGVVIRCVLRFCAPDPTSFSYPQHQNYHTDWAATTGIAGHLATRH